MLEKVKKFRDEHDDWKELAAFILSKNTGRRFKKNPGPEVQRDVEKVLLESQRELQQQKNQTQDKADGDEESSNDSEDASSEAGDESENDAAAKSDTEDADNKTDQCDTSEQTTDSSKHNNEKELNDKTSKKKNTKERNNEKTRSENLEKSSSPDKEVKPQIVRSREMAIKRFNLDEIKDGEIDIDEQKDVPSFLVAPSGSSKKSEAKPKSKFFMCESDSENSEEDEAETEDEEEKDAEDELNDDAELQEKNRMRAKDAINSTFLGSLSSMGRKQLEKRDKRNFNDYKK